MLIVEDLTLRRGHRQVLDIPYLHVQPGERVSLLGPSGSGKTTLLRVIAGLEHPRSGRIRLNDRQVAGETYVPPARRSISLLSQDYGLWPHLTAAQHIAFTVSRGRRIQPNAADQDWLRRVNLGHKAQTTPVRLSGGEQQRLALARALAVQPRLLLLDEPFANVDAVLSHELLGVLDQLHRQQAMTRLLVTHDLDEAIQRSDRLLILRDGSLIQEGDWPVICAHPADDWVAQLIRLRNR
jgi:ABC-type Fe3+/spermidine/putrescine transport system ATPase subunit